MTSTTNRPRIVVVDCLRGFALFGLFIVHMVEYFELYWYLPEPGFVHNLVFGLFGGKAYAIFALLFGLSFFIIMDNQAQRGVDFRARFSWRLALLCIFGYLHGLLYSGDILQVLAFSGFLLVVIYPLSNRAILMLAAVCLLQVPGIFLWALGVYGGISLPQPLPDTLSIYANGSFTDVLGRNLLYGQTGKWLWMIQYGRIWNIIGLFLIGFVLGRVQFFEHYREKLKTCFITLVAAFGLIGLCLWLQSLFPENRLLWSIFNHYLTNTWVLVGVLVFLLAYESKILRRLMDTLAPSGRMSLTIYVGQSLFGVPLFYGFGLALYEGFGQWNALILGLGLWFVQMALAYYWFNKFYYGPLEWLWRCLTYLSTDVPWKRNTAETSILQEGKT